VSKIKEKTVTNPLGNQKQMVLTNGLPIKVQAQTVTKFGFACLKGTFLATPPGQPKRVPFSQRIGKTLARKP
jgi:hypothetical protein